MRAGRQNAYFRYFPGASHRKYGCALTLDEWNNGNLTFKGKVKTLAHLADHLDTLNGRLIGDYTYLSTLFDLGMTERPTRLTVANRNEQTKAVFFTNIIVVGGHIKSRKSKFIRGARFEATGMREWSDVSGFTGAGVAPAGVSASATYTGAASEFIKTPSGGCD